MNDHPEPFPETLVRPDAAPDAALPASRIRAVAAPLPRHIHGLEPLSSHSIRLAAELRDQGIVLRILPQRFPHALNRASLDWDIPIAALEALGELLSDRRGDRDGFPEEALAELLVLRRCCVRRIADAEGF